MQLSVSIARTNDDQCGDLDEGIEDYCISMRRAAGRTAMVEVNVSCPNTHVGEPFTATPEALDRLFTALDKIDRPQPTLVKMPLNKPWGEYKELLDVMDVSTGGIMSGVSIPVKPNYQVPFSEQVKARADIPVTAVGLITKPKQAAKILAHGEADAVEIGRAALRDPYWPLRAANKLGIPSTEIPYAPQYVAGAY